SPASAHTFRVVAADGSGNESPGADITGVTLLENPGEVTAASHSQGVHLRWSGVSPSQYVRHYNVYISPSDFNSVEEMESIAATTETEAFIPALIDDQTYYFAVTAVNISNGEQKAVTAVSATPQSRLIAWWTMDNIEGIALKDETGDFHGEINGDAGQESGYMDLALAFDGQDDSVNIDPLADYLVEETDITISLWFNTTADEADDQENLLFSANETDGGALIRLGTGNAGGIYHAVNAEGGEYGAGFNDGAWHHLVLIQHADGQFEIIVDSAETASLSKTPAAWSTADRYSLGQEWDAGASDHYQGRIDDVRLYNYALSQEEIRELYSDLDPPEVRSLSPPDGAMAPPVEAIVITLEDLHGHVDHAVVKASVRVRDDQEQGVGGVVNVENDVFIFIPHVIPLPDGAYHVAFTAADMAGNSAEHAFSFTVDGQPPTAPAITGGNVFSGPIQER
ncbi:MAG: hypothetical protein GY859_41630, partial [Desulfobacterales bacterium]|nr:hypothetical protein [Desulfobacterales bacterium]